MGKTKTAFVSDTEKKELSGAEKYKLRQLKKEQEGKVSGKPLESNLSAQAGKIRIPGMGGGERIKAVVAEPLPEEPAEDEAKSAAKKQLKVRSKKYKEARQKIDKTRSYSLTDAIKLVKETSYSKFDGSVELHIVVKKEGLSVNTTLPFSAGKTKKIEVADEATLTKLKSGKIDFDILLATADMMPKLVPFARLLGPRGLMPNPKTGTLLKNVKDAEKFSANRLTIKTEKTQPIIHTVIGKVSQKEEELTENVNAMLDAISRKQIIKAYIKPTMGPSVKLQI